MEDQPNQPEENENQTPDIFELLSGMGLPDLAPVPDESHFHSDAPIYDAQIRLGLVTEYGETVNLMTIPENLGEITGPFDLHMDLADLSQETKQNINNVHPETLDIIARYVWTDILAIRTLIEKTGCGQMEQRCHHTRLIEIMNFMDLIFGYVLRLGGQVGRRINQDWHIVALDPGTKWPNCWACLKNHDDPEIFQIKPPEERFDCGIWAVRTNDGYYHLKCANKIGWVPTLREVGLLNNFVEGPFGPYHPL